MNRSVFLGCLLLVVTMQANAADPSPKVDMNRADAAQLDALLEGVGEKKAQAIVAWRQQHGVFRSVADVAKVKGMARLAEKNRARMVFGTQVSHLGRVAQVDDHTLLIPSRQLSLR
jgi:competence protein ComEA